MSSRLLFLKSSVLPRSRRYLYVEWEDPVFGPRAASVHKRLQEGLSSSEDASHSMAAISAQMGLVAQLRHIANELKVTPLHSSSG